MPLVQIKVAGLELAPEQLRRLQDGATELMGKVMRKKRHLTAVLVEVSPPCHWSVGADPMRVAGYVDVKVTASTNTAEEKRCFVAEAMDLLRAVLGPNLSPVSYVVVHEVAGDAWGYDGRTQADRASMAEAASKAAPVEA